MLLDTSGLLAALFEGEPRHGPCAQALSAASPPLLLSPFVLAELDYLVARHHSLDAQLALLDAVADGTYQLAAFASDGVAAARRFMARYADLAVGLADASIAVLARRIGVRDVLTLDERNFRVLPGPGGRPFRLLPADA